MQPSFEPYASPAAEIPQPQPGGPIRFGDALRFAFRAPKPWMNILVSAVLAFIPIAGPIALFGWHAEITQRLVRRHPTPIPTLDFTDFMHYLSRGVQPFVVRLIVSMPLSLLIVFGMMIAGVAGGVAGRTGDPTLVLVVWGVLALGMVLLAPLMIILTTAAYTRADLLEEIGPALKPSKLTAYVRVTWLTALGTFIAFGLLSYLMMLAGILACYVGAFVASAIVQLGQVHLRWQIYERYVARGGEPIVPKVAVMLPSEQARANPYAPFPAQGPYPPPPPPVYPQAAYPPQPPFPPR